MLSLILGFLSLLLLNLVLRLLWPPMLFRLSSSISLLRPSWLTLLATLIELSIEHLN
jgi:hypothetical protein